MNTPLKKGPPIFFSSRGRGEANGSVELRVLAPSSSHEPRMEVSASVSVAGLPGAGFIHIFPTREQIDEIVSALLEMKETL